MLNLLHNIYETAQDLRKMVMLTVLSLVIVFVIVYRLRGKKHPSVQRILGLPFLGSILDFTPSTILKTLRNYPQRYGKFIEFFYLSKKALLISDPQIAREALSLRPKRFRRLNSLETASKTLGISSSLFSSYGNKQWGRIRRVNPSDF